jgi:hypothetical protein
MTDGIEDDPVQHGMKKKNEKMEKKAAARSGKAINRKDQEIRGGCHTPEGLWKVWPSISQQAKGWLEIQSGWLRTNGIPQSIKLRLSIENVMDLKGS